jgi:hypothetical protein
MAVSESLGLRRQSLHLAGISWIELNSVPAGRGYVRLRSASAVAKAMADKTARQVREKGNGSAGSQKCEAASVRMGF